MIIEMAGMRMVGLVLSKLNLLPLALGGTLAVYILVFQPLSGTISGFSLNILAGLLLAVGGVIGAFEN